MLTEAMSNVSFCSVSVEVSGGSETNPMSSGICLFATLSSQSANSSDVAHALFGRRTAPTAGVRATPDAGINALKYFDILIKYHDAFWIDRENPFTAGLGYFAASSCDLQITDQY